MSESPLEAAVAELRKHLEQQEQEVLETKRTINSLLRRVGKDPMFADLDATRGGSAASVRADQFYGRPLATVSREVLEMKGHACQAEEILNTLAAGGFNFEAQGWKDKDRLRNFTITLAKNVAAFHRLPNGSFGLTTWYDKDAIAKKKQPRQSGSDIVDTEATVEVDLAAEPDDMETGAQR